MAIYRLEAKIIGRKAKDALGHAIPGKEVSVVAKAAYRSGQRLKDEQRDMAFDYRARSQEVVHAEILSPTQAPGWLKGHVEGEQARAQRERLWNTVEQVERRCDSQLAREFTIALPVELDRKAQIDALRNWCNEELISKGFVADVAIHKSKDGKNPHAHVLATLRPVNDNGFGKKPDMTGKFNGRADVGKGAKSDLMAWRESWEKNCNEALAAAGESARVDSRSLKDRGIDRPPEPKIGVAAMAMKKRGKDADPWRLRIVRQFRVSNQVRAAVRQIQSFGEVVQRGIDSAWMERAHAVGGHLYATGAELLRDESSGGNWQEYLKRRREREGPDREAER
ncbi:MAG TPA: MobA/MobL family protein [Fimbriimonadaceae bacterium]|nr:MobA/MobL family protein [Fimbriimonadaceae bacterium]